MRKNPYTILSLFSGAGGLDLGFAETGRFRTVLHVDADPTCIATLDANTLDTSRTKNLLADIRTFSVADLQQEEPPIDVLLAGPPCETFSSMGRRAGITDPRGTLVWHVTRVAEDLAPRVIVIENVPPFAEADGGKLVTEVAERLGQLGYRTHWKVLRACDYGAATFRRRVFLLASHLSLVEFPQSTHFGRKSGGLFSEAPFVTCGDVLGDILQSPERCLSHHTFVKHSEVVRERFGGLPQGAYDNIRKRSKPRWSEPCPSLVAGTKQGTRNHIHPLLPREFTNRECARIQGFPDTYSFSGSPSEVAKQIANAVPIPLARAVARAVCSQLESIRLEESTSES